MTILAGNHALTGVATDSRPFGPYGVVFAGTAVPSFWAFNFAAARS